jgi:phosphoribosylformylglycinamidine cyclo-ligase
MFGKDLNAIIEKDKIQVLPVFKFMGKHVEESEMFRTFNMGVGMILVVDRKDTKTVCDNTDGYVIGEMIKGDKGVDLV